MELFLPKVAYADLNSFLTHANQLIVNPLIELLFALAVVYFLWGVFEFFLNQENEEKKTSGKSHMLWGVVGITIMLGVWTILNVVLNTLGISNSEVNPQEGTVKLKDYNPPAR